MVCHWETQEMMLLTGVFSTKLPPFHGENDLQNHGG
jgi:hypothetical protein